MKNRLILAVAILLPFFYILLYVWKTSSDIVFRDDMYLIKGAVIEKFCNGTLVFSDLWRAASKTRLLGYNLVLVANTAWFGLNSRLVVLLIPFFLLATALLIHRDYRRSFAGVRSPAFISASYLLPMLILFNLVLWEGLTFDFSIIFVWSLPWFLASYYSLEDFLLHGGAISWLPAALLTSLAVLVFGQTASFPFGTALVVTLVFYLALHGRSLPDGFFMRLLAIGGMLALLAFLYVYRISDNDYFPDSRLADWGIFMRAGTMLAFILSTLAASVVGVGPAKAHLGSAVVLIVGTCVVLAYASAFVLYWKTRMYERTYLPLFMVSYALAYVIFMTVGRIGYGVQYGMASRYTCNTICGIVAMVWIAIYSLKGPVRFVTPVKGSIGAALLLIFAGLFWTADFEWRLQPARKAYFRNLHQIALRLDRAEDSDLAEFEERPRLVRESLSVLRKYRLNVYQAPAVSLASSVKLDLQAGAAATTSTASGQESVQVGYATAEQSNAAGNPYGTAILGAARRGNVISETAIQAASPGLHALVLVEQHSDAPGVNTGIAVVNRDSNTAHVCYTLRNRDGIPFASGRGTIDAGLHFAKFIRQLAEVASDFRLPANFDTSTFWGSLEISSDRPLAAMALLLKTNERNENLITAMPSLISSTVGPPSGKEVYVPHLADGDGFSTAVILINASDRPGTGSLVILDDNGRMMPVGLSGGVSGSSHRYSMRPGGLFRLVTTGDSRGTRTGWAQVIPDQGAPLPEVMGVLSHRQAGVLVSESVIPPVLPTAHARIYVDRSLNHDTALVLANPSAEPVRIALTAYRANGSERVDHGSASIGLPGHGHIARLAAELIPGLPDGFKGVLDISARLPIVALTLRSVTNARNDQLWTAFPAADFVRRAPLPLVFPDIVEGGGYTTDLILLNAGSPATSTIRFFGEKGQPLAIVR